MKRVRWHLFLLLFLPLCTFAQSRIDLSPWPGNMAWFGEGTQRVGVAIASGDMNGDGLWDVAISAPGTRNNSGDVYVFLGDGVTFDSVRFDNPAAEANLVIEGTAGLQIGVKLVMGDLNGDGRDDLVIGAPHADDSRGRVWVIFGSASPSGTVTEPDVEIFGSADGDHCGRAIGITNIGDDAYNDIVIGSPNADPRQRDSAGRVDVIAGRASWPENISLSTQASTVTVFGGQTGEQLGEAISVCPIFQGTLLGNNLNGDGYGDLIIGAPGRTYAGRTGAGAVHIFVTPESLADTVDLTTDNVPLLQDYRQLGGAQTLDLTGRAIASFNTTGIRGVLIGAPAALQDGVRGGAFYYITWDEINTAAPWADLRQATYFRVKFTGAAEDDSLGAAVAGIDELMMAAAPGANYRAREEAGQVVAITDNPILTGIIRVDTLDANVRHFFGAGAGHDLGRSLTIADLDDDGIFDPIMGSHSHTDYAGAVHAVRGGLPYFFNIYPAPGQGNIPSEDTLSFRISDDETGIATASFIMILDGITYNINHPGVSYEMNDGIYSFELVPEEPFDINVPINVITHITDTQGNRSPLWYYQFITGQDVTAPYPTQFSPAPGEVNVATTRDIAFSLRDAGDGVDSTTIMVVIDTDTVRQGDPEMRISGSISNYRVVINPESSLPPDAQIDVRIEAADLTEPSPNWMTPYDYFFFTSLDTIPPELVFIYPEPGVTIDVGTKINFRIIDTGSGVNADSTKILRTQQSGEEYGDLLFEAISQGYAFVHNPENNPYDSGLLQLTAQSRDLADDPNIMEDSTWSYNVIVDNRAPELTEAIPHPDSVGSARNTPITLTIMDNAAGIDSTTLQLEIDNVFIAHRNIIWERIEHLGYRITYQRSEGIYGDSVIVHLNVFDKTIPDGIELDTTYIFYPENDDEPPYFLLVDPPQGSEGVSVEDSLIWEAADDMTGIDPSSAYISINNADHSVLLRYNTHPVTQGAQYRFVYTPPLSLPYEDTVSVRFGISDNEEPSNDAILVYELFTEPDEYPPYLTNLSPYPGQIGVSRGADIVFHVLDAGVGVARDSLHLAIDGIAVANENIYWEEVEQGYAFRYNPPGLFGHTDTVHVSVTCYDLATSHNRMDESYWFVTLRDDREPPYMEEEQPADSSGGVSPDIILSFDLKDDGEGVDTSYTTIQNMDDPLWIATREVTPIINGFHYVLAPATDFLYSDTVTIGVNARDLAEPANVTPNPLTFSFYTQLDDASPFFTELQPAPDSSITYNRPVSFEVIDMLAGVDTSDVHIFIDSEEITNNSDDYEILIEETADGWRYTYTPYDGWNVSTTYSVTLSAADYSNIRNEIDSTYQFEVIPDLVAPYVNSFAIVRLVNDTLAVVDSTSITLDDYLYFEVLDDGIGVDANSIRLELGGRNAPEPVLTQELETGYYRVYRLSDWNSVGPQYLFPGQQVQAYISARDLSVPENTLTRDKHTFYIPPPDVELLVIPTTITPNGDGVWDEALIYHKGSSSASVDFFDMRGRKVATVQGNPASWNGNDDSGEPVPGGLYIFQVSGGGQGTIAVAR